MKAICVDENRNLKLREIAAPAAPAPGYVTVEIAAAAINHGDKAFLRAPDAAGSGPASSNRLSDVWGASGAGTVVQIGPGVPSRYLGRKVAIYRSLRFYEPALGTWSDIAQLPYLSCLPLPNDAVEKHYSGSLVNVVTAYAFLEQALKEGHHGILATAGSSATARAMLALTRRRGVPLAMIVRHASSKAEMLRLGASHVLSSDDESFAQELEHTAAELKTTAVFDGVGGALIGRILGSLPSDSSIFFYGFLSGSEPVAFHSALFMKKAATMRRFSNFETPTVRDPERLANMLTELEQCIADPLFQTQAGKQFKFEQFDQAMAYDAMRGPKPILMSSRN